MYNLVQEGFLFSIKVNRIITHIKKLNGVKRLISSFIKDALLLKDKLGVLLFQMPPSFHCTQKNLKKISDTLKYLRKNFKNLDFAFEFRHASFDNNKTKDIFQKYNCAVVFFDSSRYPKINIDASNISYFRFHGPKELFASLYSAKDIKNIAKTIKSLSHKKDRIYCYFNNDFNGYAIKNALQLKKNLKFNF